MSNKKRFSTYISVSVICCLLFAILPGCDESPTPEPDPDQSVSVEDASADVSTDGAAADAGATDVGALDADAPFDAQIDAEPLDELTINSLVPNRGPVLGGTEIRVIGSGFVEGISVLIAGQNCTELRVESRNHLRCSTPQAAPGVAPVTVVRSSEQNGRETATLEEGFTFYESVVIDAVIPSRVPTRGGTELIILGGGLIEGTRVAIGDSIADNFTINDDGSVSVIAPAAPPGPADVTATNFNGSDRLQNAVFYFEVLEVGNIQPAVGPLSGGTEVTMTGRGLLRESRVSFGQNPSEVQGASEDRTELVVNSPAGEAAGPTDLLIENENGSFRAPGAFVYFDDLANGFLVAGIAPTSGPLEGGNDVWVAGNGFTPNTTVEFDGRLVDCDHVDANRMRCTVPPSVEGVVPVTVNQDGESLQVPGGYTYFQRLELIAIEPDSGAIAGGTAVTISGIGLTPDLLITLGDNELEGVQYIDETTMIGVTPANTPGPVNVRGVTEFSRSTIEGGFTYFDPTADFGGVWGNAIDSTINVTVINGATGRPLNSPDMDGFNTTVVIANPDTGFSSSGITNELGQITFSDPNLSPPVNVTGAKQGFEATTIEDVENENVTLILQPNEAEGEPPPPVPAVTLSGIVTGLDALPKPVNEIYVNVIVVETTHTSPYNRSRLPPPGPGGLLVEDGLSRSSPGPVRSRSWRRRARLTEIRSSNSKMVSLSTGICAAL